MRVTSRHAMTRRGWLGRLGLLLIGVMLGIAVSLGYLLSQTTRVAPPRALPDEPSVTVTLGEPFLAAVIRDALAAPQNTLAISGVTVEAVEDALTVRGTMELLGQPLHATATLHPVVRAGHLKVVVVSTDFGLLPVPLEQTLETQINRRLGAMLADLPVTITGADVERHRGLIVTAQVDLTALEAGLPPPRS